MNSSYLKQLNEPKRIVFEETYSYSFDIQFLPKLELSINVWVQKFITLDSLVLWVIEQIFIHVFKLTVLCFGNWYSKTIINSHSRYNYLFLLIVFYVTWNGWFLLCSFVWHLSQLRELRSILLSTTYNISVFCTSLFFYYYMRYPSNNFNCIFHVRILLLTLCLKTTIIFYFMTTVVNLFLITRWQRIFKMNFDFLHL